MFALVEGKKRRDKCLRCIHCGPLRALMPDQPIALSFSERMAGGFALGMTDPAEGRHAGEAAGTELAMHATVLISNLDKFLSDPAHSGDLRGTIDFSPLG